MSAQPHPRPTRQQVCLFKAADWSGPSFQPTFGAEYDEREPRPAQHLSLDMIDRSASWVLTLAGEATYKDGESRHRMLPGTVLVYELPNRGVIIHPPKGKRWRHVWITVTGEHALGFLRHVMRIFGKIHTIPAKGEASRLARRLIKLAAQCPERDARFWSLETYAWLNAWWREAEAHSPKLSEALRNQDEARRVALASGSLKGMARALGYSPAYLSRRLKQMWDGNPPGAVLRKTRMEEAARLLRDTDLAVGEVATKAGYGRASSFVTAFKSHFGKTPLRYRHEGSA